MADCLCSIRFDVLEVFKDPFRFGRFMNAHECSWNAHKNAHSQNLNFSISLMESEKVLRIDTYKYVQNTYRNSKRET